MDNFIIHTYGGGDLLYSVFNAIGMLFKSDSEYLTPVGTMAMALGSTYVAIKAVFKAEIGLLIKSWMLPSMVVFLLLFSIKTKVWIKDEIDLSAPKVVANIPIGISFFAHIGSTVSHELSKLLEGVMLPLNAGRASNSGILYGMKAAAKVRDIQISDPVLLYNAKEYMRQCYMKPYVIGNFGNHRSAAIKETNLMAYLTNNPAKNFGIYPKNAGGSVGKFLTCTEAGDILKTAIEVASKDTHLLRQFAVSIGLASKAAEQTLVETQLRQITANAFQYLDQGTTEISEWVQQAMLLNANREAYDDWREKVGHSRVFPELVRMQATRGLYQYSFGSIIGGEMAESMIPAASQPTMLALVIMLFVVILPFALLPGGWTYVTTAIKLIIWVCSWPIFYTIINALAMIQLKDSVGVWGESGLSLVGQAGFSQLIMMKYATVQSLITATPFISFAIVFASPYALSGIAGSTANVASSAGIGSSMADGNLTMGNVSTNNATRNQQNLAPTLIMGGGVIDDGGLRMQSGQDGRSMVLTEYGDNLLNNHTGSEGFLLSATESLGNAKSQMASLSQRESETASLVRSEATDLAKSIANGTATASGVTVSDTDAIRNAFGMSNTTNKGESVTKGITTGTSSNVGIQIPGIVTGFTGLGGGTSTNASNNHEVRNDLSQQEQQAFNAALEHVKTAAKNNSISTTNSHDMRVSNSLSANLSKQEQIANEKAMTQQDIDTYSNQVSYAKSNSGVINRNLNDQFLNEVMRQNPELSSKEQALRWTKSHVAESAAIGRNVTNNYNPFETPDYKARIGEIAQNTPSVDRTRIATTDGLKQQYQNNSAAIENQGLVKDATGGAQTLKLTFENAARSSNMSYNKDTANILTENLNPMERNIANNIHNEQFRGEKSVSNDVHNTLKKQQQKLSSSTGKSSLLRVIEDIGDTSTVVIDTITGDNKGKK